MYWLVVLVHKHNLAMRLRSTTHLCDCEWVLSSFLFWGLCICAMQVLLSVARRIAGSCQACCSPCPTVLTHLRLAHINLFLLIASSDRQMPSLAAVMQNPETADVLLVQAVLPSRSLLGAHHHYVVLGIALLAVCPILLIGNFR